MPSIAAHMAVAKKVGENLNIYNEDFIRGNLLPDLYEDKTASHYKKQGTFFLIPDMELAENSLDLNNYQDLGYYVHLLVDLYYLEDFLAKKAPNIDVFEERIIYKDYDNINIDIVKHFNLDVPYIINVLSKYNIKVDKRKLDKNIECLSITSIGPTKYLKNPEFPVFLDNISLKISEDIKKFVKNDDR